MVHFDVQLIGGIVLHQGKIAEMATGEGKTLVATLPTYLNALAGKACTSSRSTITSPAATAEWMGEIYEYPRPDRRRHPEPDVQRRTARSSTPAMSLSAPPTNSASTTCATTWPSAPRIASIAIINYAIIDEVDSILIDEARTPLIISGQVDIECARPLHAKCGRLSKRLVRKQNHCWSTTWSPRPKRSFPTPKAATNSRPARLCSPPARRAQKQTVAQSARRTGRHASWSPRPRNAYMRDKKLHEIDDRLYYFIDEREHTIALTDLGTTQLTKAEEQASVRDPRSVQHALRNRRRHFALARGTAEEDRRRLLSRTPSARRRSMPSTSSCGPTRSTKKMSSTCCRTAR